MWEDWALFVRGNLTELYRSDMYRGTCATLVCVGNNGRPCFYKWLTCAHACLLYINLQSDCKLMYGMWWWWWKILSLWERLGSICNIQFIQYMHVRLRVVWWWSEYEVLQCSHVSFKRRETMADMVDMTDDGRHGRYDRRRSKSQAWYIRRKSTGKLMSTCMNNYDEKTKVAFKATGLESHCLRK